MTSLEDVEWLPCLLEPKPDRTRDRALKARFGRPPPGIDHFFSSRWYPEATTALNRDLQTCTHIDGELADLVGLVISQENSCRYCYATMRTFLHLLGFSPARIRELEQTMVISDLPDAQRRALDYARRLARCEPPPGRADVDALRAAGFSDAAIRELIVKVGMNTLFNRSATIAALPPHAMEAMPHTWRFRIMRPFLARIFRARRQRGTETRLTSKQRTGPWSSFVNGLDGLTVAPLLREMIDRLFASSELPTRTKALTWAVIARTLGCEPCEVESRRLLIDAGMTLADIDAVLDHLELSTFDEVDAVVIPFARETVSYEPASLQRRAGAVRAALSDSAFIEVIATAGLANAVGRIASGLAHL